MIKPLITSMFRINPLQKTLKNKNDVIVKLESYYKLWLGQYYRSEKQILTQD